MAGAQVILALKSSKGTPEVKTFNLVSYGDVREQKLSFDVWDLSAESNATSGDFIIFASVKVPEKAESLNQIWQVGAAVNNGKPAKHEFAPANKDAKATLELVAAQRSGKTAAPSPAPASTSAGGNTTSGTTSTTNTTSTTGTKDSGRGYRIREVNVGLYFGLLVLLGSFIGF